jgi:hypothetical protein
VRNVKPWKEQSFALDDIHQFKSSNVKLDSHRSYVMLLNIDWMHHNILQRPLTAFKSLQIWPRNATTANKSSNDKMYCQQLLDLSECSIGSRRSSVALKKFRLHVCGNFMCRRLTCTLSTENASALMKIIIFRVHRLVARSLYSTA